ncbi:hypothetical protein [Streptomyces sp. NBC_00582]|uniref:hypothetical protein n=1 Tax=Streptomyces sp. NBC_00582 TaxID=2975783 RepID=UPI002E80BC2C|nr:hypothetical protein [Streptomyces sp. NBC_00582]WUB67484.1 hypothetical protein OG852_47420 [Streptomyces sp. NBC_00582]
MAALDGESLAYLTIREGEDEQGRVLGGRRDRPRRGGADLAERVVSEIRAWDASGGNDAPEPGFRMAVADSRERLTEDDPRFIIDKPYSRLVVDWARNG